MLSLYRTLSLRYFSRRRARAVLLAASIALGVATLVATRALNDTMARAFQASSNPLAGISDLVVTNGDLHVKRALRDDIRKVPGVRKVKTLLLDQARAKIGGELRRVQVMGVELDEAVKEFGEEQDRGSVTLSDDTEGRFGAMKVAMLAPPFLRLGSMTAPPVVLGKELADALFTRNQELPENKRFFNLEVNGASFGVYFAGSIKGSGDLWSALSGYVVLMDQDDAADMLGIPRGMVSRIDIVLSPGTDPAEARKDIEKVLAGRARVRTPFEQNEASRAAMASMRTGFALCGVAALIVGMFLVYNALSVGVAERRHEIGILLAVGATRRQILALFAGEAAVLGLVGAAVGIPVGIGLAYLGLRPMQAILSDLFANMRASQVEVGPGLIALALGAGMAATLVASLVPAFQAARESPAEAVRRVPRAPSARALLLYAGASLLLILTGGLFILFRASLPTRWGTFGGISLVMIGGLASSPFFAAVGARALQLVARRWFRIEWRLAADNLVNAPARTGIVIGALAAGVALVMNTAGVILSNRQALREWIDEAFPADLVVSAGSPIGSGEQGIPMDESIGKVLRDLPEVETALPIRYARVNFRDVQVMIVALEAADAYAVQKPRFQAEAVSSGTRRLTSAVAAAKLKELELLRRISVEPNAVVVSENFAALHGIGEGDTITLPGQTGPVELRVIGKLVDYSWNLGSIIMNRRDYVANWQDTKADFFDVYLHKSSDAPRVKETIAARYGARYDLQPLTTEELASRIDDMVERIHGIAYGQQIVVMLVAALGVVTSLLISVLQRRREMGLLRAIGAPQGQVIHAVLAEACLMGLLGTLIGVLFGIPLEWYVLRVLILEEAGFLFPVYIPWAAAGVIAVVATATATLAGLGPAISAVRQRIPEAIAYE